MLCLHYSIVHSFHIQCRAFVTSHKWSCFEEGGTLLTSLLKCVRILYWQHILECQFPLACQLHSEMPKRRSVCRQHKECLGYQIDKTILNIVKSNVSHSIAVIKVQCSRLLHVYMKWLFLQHLISTCRQKQKQEHKLESNGLHNIGQWQTHSGGAAPQPISDCGAERWFSSNALHVQILR